MGKIRLRIVLVLLFLLKRTLIQNVLFLWYIIFIIHDSYYDLCIYGFVVRLPKRIVGNQWCRDAQEHKMESHIVIH